MCIIYKPGLGLCNVDWLFHNNHTENREQEIAEIRVNVNAISTPVNIPNGTSIVDIEAATCEDAHL